MASTTNLHSDREAGAPEKTKITLEMIDAGVMALEEFSGSYAYPQLAAAVYSAMRSCELDQTHRRN